jgi:hypothetical protein
MVCDILLFPQGRVGDRLSGCERVRGQDRLGSRDGYSLFALLAAIIAAWVTGRYQLTGNFRWQQRGAIQFDAQSGRLVPREIEEKQTARLVVKMPKGDDVS